MHLDSLTDSLDLAGWLTSYREGKNKTWGALPDTMNWKAYWGGDADVTILHW